MILMILNWLAAHLPARLIPAEDGALYLLRVKLWGWMPGSKSNPFCSAYLHRFHLPDLDRALHNHPWRWSFSLILAGGYEEEKRLKNGRVIIRTMKPGRINILGANDFHRVTKLNGKETWSLFVAGRKFQGWGFLVPGFGFLPHRERFKMRGILVEPLE